MTEGLSQSSLRVAFADPFALGVALPLDAMFNLWICGNREDFLSVDPLAPSVRNPVPLGCTALLTCIEESQYATAVSVGAHTHGQPCADIHTPPLACFTGHVLHSTGKQLLQSVHRVYDLLSTKPIHRKFHNTTQYYSAHFQRCSEKSHFTNRTVHCSSQWAFTTAPSHLEIFYFVSLHRLYAGFIKYL